VCAISSYTSGACIAVCVPSVAIQAVLVLQCVPSIAPLQLRNYHSEYNSSPFFFHSSSVGCGNPVADNLFQIALQIDMIIE